MGLDNGKCPYGCNSKGQVNFKGSWYPCPIHGKKSSDILVEGTLPNGESLYKILNIPDEYQGKWVSDIAKLFTNDDIHINCAKDSIIQLKYVLESLMNTFAVENNIYMNSLFLYANPVLIDLKKFMYTLQRIAFENNISVLPAITINTLCGLLALENYSEIQIRSDADVQYIRSVNKQAGEGAVWNLRTGLTYSDYLNVSACFVLDNLSTTEANQRVFSGFLEERGQLSLPTYVFSTAYFDKKRMNLWYDVDGSRRLSKLNPYLLIGKSQDGKAREQGFYKYKDDSVQSKESDTYIKGYNLFDFDTMDDSTNEFPL